MEEKLAGVSVFSTNDICSHWLQPGGQCTARGPVRAHPGCPKALQAQIVGRHEMGDLRAEQMRLAYHSQPQREFASTTWCCHARIHPMLNDSPKEYKSDILRVTADGVDTQPALLRMMGLINYEVNLKSGRVAVQFFSGSLDLLQL